METPVALIVFNRPQHTRRVLEALSEVKPSTLYVIADGPRSLVPTDAIRCTETRALIEEIDWDSKVIKNFADHNMGCFKRVVSGLDWVFAQTEEAILLEDDCIPEASFFQFCKVLLEKYRNNEEVMMIGGQSFLDSPINTSYYFSHDTYIWGWATWRRAWTKYDPSLAQWPERRDTAWLTSILGDEGRPKAWRRVFDKIAAGSTYTWDRQWTYSVWINGGLTVVPAINMVSNIGFDKEATHTSAPSGLAELPTQPMTFPLVHPARIEWDRDLDQRSFRIRQHLEKQRRSTPRRFGSMVLRPLRAWLRRLNKASRQSLKEK